MASFYGSIDNDAGNQSSENGGVVFSKLVDTKNKKHPLNKFKKLWKVGAVLFVCANAALACKGYTRRKYKATVPALLQEVRPENIEAGLLRHEVIALIRDQKKTPPPFSTRDPVADLKIYGYDHRPKFSKPGHVFGPLYKGQKQTGLPLPTNKWYENMVLLPDGQDPSNENNAYTVPYLVNAIGPIPGIKLHATRLLAMNKIVQVTFIDGHGMTLGTAQSCSDKDAIDQIGDIGTDRRYVIDYKEGENSEGTGGVRGPLTPLGLTLKWGSNADKNNSDTSFTKMTSSIIRGMPYGTMHYHYSDGDFGTTLPTVVSQISLAGPPVADSKTQLTCASDSDKGLESLVQKSVKITFLQSDFTWQVFYSEPVYVRCYEYARETPFILQVTRLAKLSGEKKRGDVEENGEVIFTSRIALSNNCTRGTNPSHCVRGKPHNRSDWENMLESHADVYPGKDTKIDYTFFSDEKDDGGEYSYLQFDWDARRVSDNKRADSVRDAGLLMYSLPHHREILRPQMTSATKDTFQSRTHCTPSLNGDACVVEGSTWVLKEDMYGQPSFWAPRPPMASAIPNLAKALSQDIKFRVPDYFARGAGDTYFSGKILAKLARILLIYKELADTCSNPNKFGEDYVRQCKVSALPSSNEFDEALNHLRSSTEIWINGTAETPFVFDSSWGGLVSCGCLFDDKINGCRNKFPDCPAFSDPGLDFGHAFYNDHHFHQGYHIYAASTVAFFDDKWGKEQYDNVLLLIRDIANPSPDDKYFPTYRMKDWYLGNSWAGGIARSYFNGRNQESSSESIAAYEAISLYGSVMADVWSRDNQDGSKAKAAVSRHIREVGRLLTATELRSADRYWHVRQSGKKKGDIYPSQYKPLVVGIMWNMMAQFQTWFGNAPHLAYGIQLLPLTPVSEQRDDIDWAKQLYPSFAESCADANDCDKEGWGILQHAILALVGHPMNAIAYAESLPKEAYTSAGGNGHSLTNSIWYYSTRPKTKPLQVSSESTPSPSPQIDLGTFQNNVFDCGCPKTCTKQSLNNIAGGHSCQERIMWLQKTDDLSQKDACSKVAGVEFTDVCAGCDPNRCTAPKVSPSNSNHDCHPCTIDQCKDKGLNRCPVLTAPYLCTDGHNVGGCSMIPWTLHTKGGSNCNSCCQLTFDCL